jgi:hypothetical protein
MKTMLIATLLTTGAGAAQAQYSAKQPGMQPPPAVPSTSALPTGAGSPDASTVKPKGQIITLKTTTDRKVVGIRAHCSNGTVYWSPEIEEGLYYCEGKDAPAPAPAAPAAQ